MRTILLPTEAKKTLSELKTYLRSDERKNAFDMAWWGVVIVGDKKAAKKLLEEQYDVHSASGTAYEALRKQRPPCGAVCCLAGSLCIMKGLIKPTKDSNNASESEGLIYKMGLDTWDKAAKALGISRFEAGALFLLPTEQELYDYDTTEEYYAYSDEDGNVWPLGWARKYFDAASPKERLSVALAYINDVIKNGLQVRDEEGYV